MPHEETTVSEDNKLNRVLLELQYLRQSVDTLTGRVDTLTVDVNELKQSQAREFKALRTDVRAIRHTLPDMLQLIQNLGARVDRIERYLGL